MDNAIIGAIRILHDATVVTINTGGTVPSYATVSWADPEEIAYCEMVADLAEILGENDIDEHTATALLTGIVAATDQFKNIKANPKVMQLAAKLMSFGANQQLISIKLEEGYKLDQQNPVQQPNAPQEQQQQPAQDQFMENLSQNVEATTNAVNVINNDMARNNAENAIEQISSDGYVHHDGQPAPQTNEFQQPASVDAAPFAPQPPQEVPAPPEQQPPQMEPQTPEPPQAELQPQEQQFQSPQMPQPSGAPWPPKVDDMQHGRDYFDYYNNPANPGQPAPPVSEPQQPVPAEPAPAPEPEQQQQQPPIPPMPAPPNMDMGGMPPMPPMPMPMPEPTGNVMNDLANYAPPTIQEPSIPQSEPTPGFFAPPPVGGEIAQPPFPAPVQQDITTRSFMGGDPDLDNPGAPTPIPGDQQLSEDTANAVPDTELADLGNIAAQATAEELSSDSGRAAFDVSQELGSGQSPNPFLTSNTPGPEVNDPAAQLQQQSAPQPPGEAPSNQFKIPGQ
jgi:hypothetical protein